MIRSYAEILRSLAADRPEAPALTYDDQTWTFAELHARSSRTAQALRAAGVHAGDRVGLLTRNCAECFELLFACSKIGAVYTGLNWRLSAAEISAILDDATPALLIAGATERALLAGSKTLRTIELGIEFTGWRDAHPALDPGHVGAPDEPILLLYTSGTTGLPTGAIITNEGL